MSCGVEKGGLAAVFESLQLGQVAHERIASAAGKSVVIEDRLDGTERVSKSFFVHFAFDEFAIEFGKIVLRMLDAGALFVAVLQARGHFEVNLGTINNVPQFAKVAGMIATEG